MNDFSFVGWTRGTMGPHTGGYYEQGGELQISPSGSPLAPAESSGLFLLDSCRPYFKLDAACKCCMYALHAHHAAHVLYRMPHSMLHLLGPASSQTQMLSNLLRLRPGRTVYNLT